MNKSIHRLKDNVFIRGSIILTFASFTAGFLNYLFNSLSSKVLGPSGYSEISTLFAYLAVFSIPIGALRIETIRRIGEESEDRLHTLANWLARIRSSVKPFYLTLFFTLYSSLILVIPTVTNLGTATTAALLILLPIAFLNSLQEAVFESLRWFKVLGIILIAGGILKTASAVLAYFSGQSLSLLLTSLIASAVLTLSLLYLFLRRQLPRIKTSQNSKKSLLTEVFNNRSLVIITCSYLGFALLNNLDMMVAKRLLTANLAGVYGSWDLLSKIILYVSAPISTVSLVFFSSPEHKENHISVLLATLAGQLLLGILIYFGYITLGKEIVKLIFTPEYLDILPVIGLAAIFGILYTQIGLINNFFMANKSYYSLLLPALIPFYALAMIIRGAKITNLIQINLIFGAVTLVIYISALIRFRSAQPRIA